MTWEDDMAYCKVCGKKFEVESTSPSKVERAVLDAFVKEGWRFLDEEGSLICKDCARIMGKEEEGMTDIKQCDSCGRQEDASYGTLLGAEISFTRHICTVGDKPYGSWYLCQKCAKKKLRKIEQIIREEASE